MLNNARQKNLVLCNVDMFMWTNDFHNPLAHAHFHMGVDEWMSVNKSHATNHSYTLP